MASKEQFYLFRRAEKTNREETIVGPTHKCFLRSTNKKTEMMMVYN